MNPEKVCTLSVDHAIRIAKIIATAPPERMPMITQLFSQSGVNLEGLDELIENASLGRQGALIDTAEFVRDLTAGQAPTEKGYLFTPEYFNQFCLARNLQPRLVKRHLYANGWLEGSTEADGKLGYSITIFQDGKAQRRIAIKTPESRGHADES